MKARLFKAAVALLVSFAVPAHGAVYQASSADEIRDGLWCVATNGMPGEVFVDAGEYEISEPLLIYPGTTFTLDDDAVIRYVGESGGAMLVGGHFDDQGAPCSGENCAHGYSQCSDVVVQGGTWDRNAADDDPGEAFRFCDASAITICDLMVANCQYGACFIEVDDAKIERNVAVGGTGLLLSSNSTFRAEGNIADDAEFVGVFAGEGAVAIVAGEADADAASFAVPESGVVYGIYSADQLQDRLWLAGSDNEHGIVAVPAGEYVITDTLRIYPETTLVLADDAVVRHEGDSGCMLMGCHFDDYGQPCSGDDCPHGGYTQCHDVVVQGGLWDRNSTADELTQAIVFRHACGITIRGLTVEHCSNHHFNLSGSKDVVVDGVCFTGQVRYTGHREDFWLTYEYGDESRYNPIEAIHLDYLDSIGEASARPLDNTPCCNILVTNCVFDGVFSGVGVHHLPPPPLGKPARDIHVVDCDFRNLHAFSVYLYGVESGVVENNIVTGGLGILYGNDSSFIVTGNSISGSKQYGVFARNECVATITGNTFENIALRAIHLEDKTVVTATRNEISGTGDNAILMRDCGKSIIDWNTISGCAKCAILAMDKTSLYARNNTIESPGTHGISSTGGASLDAANNTIRFAKKNGFVLNGGTAKLSNNKIFSPGVHGIYGENSAKVTAISNTIESPGVCGFSFATKARLTTSGKNVVKNPKNQGVRIEGAGACTISGMQITGSGADGIRIIKTAGCTVSGNTISGVKAKKAGIVMEQCKSGTVKGNTISNSTGHGIRIYGTKASPCTVTVSKNKSTGTASVYFDIMLGEWSQKCMVIENTLGYKRFKIAPTGTSGNTYRPLGTSLSKLSKKGKAAATVMWAAQQQASGFQIEYSTSKKFPASKTKQVFATEGKTSKVVKGLVAKKKYWFRIRTFHTVDKKKYFSSWSAAKSIKL